MSETEIRISTAGISRRDGRYFVALRKPGTSIGESWEFPGGKHRHGETPRETLKREFNEEFAADIDVGDLIFVGEFSNRGRGYRLEAYAVTIRTPDTEMVYPDHQCTGWKTLEELRRCRMADSDRQIVAALSDG